MRIILRLVFMAVMLTLLSLIVTPHELGHFAAMRAVGVGVKKVAIGFGPELVGFHDSQGTTWSVHLLPLGGFTETTGQELEHASSASRIFIDFGGMLANVLMGVILLMAVYWRGRFTPQAMPERIRRLPQPLAVIAAAFWAAGTTWIRIPWSILTAMTSRDRFRKLMKGVSGPIGLLVPDAESETPKDVPEPKELSLFGDAKETEDLPFVFRMLHIMAIFSVGLAGFNLLPLVPLDGGQVVFELIELLSKPLADVFALASLIVFGTMVFLIFWNDVSRIFQKKSGSD